MDQFYSYLVLGASVLFGSAIPFVPTGELVSGAAALADHSIASVLVIFLVGWVASVVGDTLLLLEVRLGRRPLQSWLDRRPFGLRVSRAQQTVTRNAFTAIVSGRLLPGGRAPVIAALGLSHFPVRRFAAFDAVACALWAAVYASIGSIGGSLASQPIWGMVIAIAAAVSVSLVVQQIRRVRRHHQLAARTDANGTDANGAEAGLSDGDLSDADVNPGQHAGPLERCASR